MKINLRKSAALQIAIDRQIAAVDMPLSVNIDRYVMPITAVNKAKDTFNQGFLKKRELIDVLHMIREKTAAAAERAGVSRLLTEDARLGKVIGLLQPLAANRDYAKTEGHLNAAQTDLRNEPPVQYAHQRREFFTASIIFEEETKAWEKEVADLKRQKQAISDALLEANVKHEIELADEDVEVLKKYGLI